MTLRHSFTASTVTALTFSLTTLCFSEPAQQAQPVQQTQPAAGDTSPQVLDVQGGKIRVVTVASGLLTALRALKTSQKLVVSIA